MNPISIGYSSNQALQRAQDLSEVLQLPISNTDFPRLQVTEDRLEFLIKGFSPLAVDFNSPLLQKRRQAGKNQGLIQACKPHEGMRIIDATAGWGKDAAILASFGADVLLLERNPIMASLLEDGLRRLTMPYSIKVLNIDSKQYLRSLMPEGFPDLIYIDPMHPERQKSALVKKEMQALQKLIGTDYDAEELIYLAIECSLGKVVVKWPQKLQANIKPFHSIPGKTVRFDIYRKMV